MNKTYKGWFIYNTITGNCWSDNLYYNTPASTKKLEKDFELVQRLKPTMAMGEATFDKTTRRLIEQSPIDVYGVRYPGEARAEEVLRAPTPAK